MATAKKEVSTEKKPTVTTVKTEVTLGKAAQSIERSALMMIEGLEALKKFQEQITDLDLQIATKEQMIESLKLEYTNKLEQLRVELALEVKGDEAGAVTKILAKYGMEAIESTELAKIKKDLSDLKLNFDKEVRADVAKAENAIKASYENAAKLKEQQFLTQQADNSAAIKMMTERVKFMESANEDLKKQLTEALAANVKIAEAASKGGSNITLGNGK